MSGSNEGLPIVLFPLRQERLAFCRRFTLSPTSEASCPAWVAMRESTRLLVAEIGIGDEIIDPLRWLLDAHRPEFVVLAGFAGGLAPELVSGDVVLAESIQDESGTTLPATWPPDSPSHVRHGRVLTTASIGGGVRAKAALRAFAGGADLVEMEAMTVARHCQERRVPFGCLRVVLDDARTELPEGIGGLTESGRIRWGALARFLAFRPWRIFDLIRLGRASKRCSERLADALLELLDYFKV